MNEPSIFRKATYYVGISALQFGTLLFILVISGFYKPFASATLSQDDYHFIPPRIIENTQRVIHVGRPLKLQIDAIDMDTELLDGVYNSADNTWTLSPNGVHYATASAPANDFGGSTFIYGHNNPRVFGSLTSLKFGDEVRLLTDNKLTFTYRYARKAQLQPTDTSPLTYQSSPPILTIQTCSGNWQERRSLFYFGLVRVTNANGEIVYG